MATYVVGDVQGCFLTFKELLHKIKFDHSLDHLILLGDVLNRGPSSLETLRFIKKNSHCMEMVLGNHEIFAIALFLGIDFGHKSHSLQALFDADDKEELINFLRCQPLIKKQDNNIFVHAGILPNENIDSAIDNGKKISVILQNAGAKKFLKRFYEKIPCQYEPSAGPQKKMRFALAYLTLIRMCSSKDKLDLDYKGIIKKAPKGLKPWFSMRNDGNFNIYFGHWAALGLFNYKRYYCLDSGCAWGNKLSALRLNDGQIFQVDCKDGLFK
jgi:bis(5'-nucleosyl)-tetraphosphatase (symmetrical)